MQKQRYIKKTQFYINKLSILKTDLSDYLIDLQKPFEQIQKLKELQIFQDIEPSKENFEADILLDFTNVLMHRKNLDLFTIAKRLQSKFEDKYQQIFENLRKNPKQFFLNQTDCVFERIVIKKQKDFLEEFENEIFFWVPKDDVCKLYDNEEFVFLKQCINLQKKRLTLFSKLKTLVSKSRKMLLNKKEKIHSLQKKINEYLDSKKSLCKQQEKVDYYYNKLTGLAQENTQAQTIYIPRQVTESFLVNFSLSFDICHWTKNENKEQYIFQSLGNYDFALNNMSQKQKNIKKFLQNQKEDEVYIKNVQEHFLCQEQKQQNQQSHFRFVRIESKDEEFKEYHGIIDQNQTCKQLCYKNQFDRLVEFINYNLDTDEELQSQYGESLKSSQMSIHDSNYQMDDSFLILDNNTLKNKFTQQQLLILDFSENQDEKYSELYQKLTAFKISTCEFPIPTFENLQKKLNKKIKEQKLTKEQVIALIGIDSKKNLDNFDQDIEVCRQAKNFVQKYGKRIFFPKFKIFKKYFKIQSYMNLLNLNWQRKIDFLHEKRFINQKNVKLCMIVLFMGQDQQFLIDKQVHIFFEQNCRVQTAEIKYQMKKCLVKRYFYDKKILKKYKISDEEVLNQLKIMIKGQLILNYKIKLKIMTEEKNTNWTFLFSMVAIEFVLILTVFVVERYMKSKNQNEAQERDEQKLLQPPENSLVPTNTLRKNRINN